MPDILQTLDITVKAGEIIGLVVGLPWAAAKLGRISGRVETVFEQYGKDIVELKDAAVKFNETGNKMVLHGIGLSELKTVVTKLADKVDDISVQKNRLDNQAERMARIERTQDEFRRGEGLIEHRAT